MQQNHRKIPSHVTYAKLKVDLSAKPRILKALKSSLIPEIKVGKRSQLLLRSSKIGDRLDIIISSTDLVSLRASLNTNLRLAASSLRAINSIESMIQDRPQKD